MVGPRPPLIPLQILSGEIIDSAKKIELTRFLKHTKLKMAIYFQGLQAEP